MSSNLLIIQQTILEIDLALAEMMVFVNSADGTLRSRPMATQEVEFDGELWFFTNAEAPKVDEMQQHQQVNVSYAAPNQQKYVSVSGTAQLMQDRQKIEQLWNPSYKAWFPKGLDDPNLALIKVSVDKAEYWVEAASAVVRLVGFVKAAITGEPIGSGGENKKVEAPFT